MRLDMLLVRRGLTPAREKAKAAITAGLVLVDGRVCTKPGQEVAQDAELTVTAPAERYVSRGGYKLEKALDTFSLDMNGKVCLDLGASTGGFTDCMLQQGAAQVYAVDVGSGQLAASLRNDPRVISWERTDFRLLQAERFPVAPDFACADLSFISLRLLFPVLADLLRPEGEAVCLVKPQFEAGRSAVGKRGVVKDAQVHLRVLLEIANAAAASGFTAEGLTFSPVRGQNGNIEYLLLLRRGGRPLTEPEIGAVVQQAYRALQNDKKGR